MNTKKRPRDDEFIIVSVMTESLPSGKLLHSLFAGLLSFALSNEMQSKICYTQKQNSSPVHMNKICLELGTFEEFANVVPQTLAIDAKKCLSSCDKFFESRD